MEEITISLKEEKGLRDDALNRFSKAVITKEKEGYWHYRQEDRLGKIEENAKRDFCRKARAKK